MKRMSGMVQTETHPAIAIGQRQSIIQAQRCFAELSPEECAQLAGLLQEVHVVPGDVIVQEGDRVDSVYFIISGNADVRHVSLQEGMPRVKSIATLREGGTIGLNDVGFYSLTGRRTATVVANTTMLLLRLSLPVFNGFALANRHVSQVMREYTATVLRGGSNKQ